MQSPIPLSGMPPTRAKVFTRFGSAIIVAGLILTILRLIGRA